MKTAKSLALVLLAVSITACGGGGGGKGNKSSTTTNPAKTSPVVAAPVSTPVEATTSQNTQPATAVQTEPVASNADSATNVADSVTNASGSSADSAGSNETGLTENTAEEIVITDIIQAEEPATQPQEIITESAGDIVESDNASDTYESLEDSDKSPETSANETPAEADTPETAPSGSDSSDATASTELNNSYLSLSWDIPVSREDGVNLPLYELAGYEIRYTINQDDDVNVIKVNDPLQTELVLDNLQTGYYEFTVAAYDTEGIYSEFSTPEGKMVE